MNRLWKRSVTLLSLVCMLSAVAAGRVPYSSESTAVLASDINAVLLPAGGTHQWGVMVMDLTTGQVLYTHQPDAWMTPASTMKVVTAVAAVKELGEDYRFNTTLWVNGTVRRGVLHGSMTVQFSGDPTLTHGDLVRLLRALKKAGIHHITGPIYLDTHKRGDRAYAPGWMWDDLSFRHGAPMGAIIIDENSFPIELLWSQKKKQAILREHLQAGVVRIRNHVAKRRASPQECPLLVYSHPNNHYELSGCMPNNRLERELWLAIRRPSRYAAVLIRQALKDRSIQWSGKIKQHRKPKQSRLLATHVSQPLPVLIHRMLKESDNMIANALLEAVGAKRFQASGNWQDGTRAVKYHLQKLLSLPPTGWRMVDGSGASRYNVLSPHVLVSLFDRVHRDPVLARVIVPALPIAGEDGTLVGRMRHTTARGRVHAKTGTMTGVSALSGLIDRPDGHLWAFAVMANGLVDKARVAHVWEDALCQVLVRTSMQ